MERVNAASELHWDGRSCLRRAKQCCASAGRERREWKTKPVVRFEQFLFYSEAVLGCPAAQRALRGRNAPTAPCTALGSWGVAPRTERTKNSQQSIKFLLVGKQKHLLEMWSLLAELHKGRLQLAGCALGSRQLCRLHFLWGVESCGEIWGHNRRRQNNGKELEWALWLRSDACYEPPAVCGPGWYLCFLNTTHDTGQTDPSVITGQGRCCFVSAHVQRCVAAAEGAPRSSAPEPFPPCGPAARSARPAQLAQEPLASWARSSFLRCRHCGYRCRCARVAVRSSVLPQVRPGGDFGTSQPSE